MQAVLSILLSTFAGFGVAMSGSSIVVEVMRWKRRRDAVRHQSDVGDEMMLHPSQRPRQQGGEAENQETFSGN